MKTKLLFSAALLAATVGAQAVPNTGSSMLVQLLESQRLENNVAVLAEGEETSVDVPTSIASYDFQGESADVQFKRVGNGVIPYFVPLSATERGLKFTEGGAYTDIGYVQVANPFYGDENIEMQGATVSLWAYLDNANAKALFGFGLGQDIYEDFTNSGSFGLQTDGYMPYNVSGSYIDFRPVAANPSPQGQMSMVTMTFTSTGVSLYVNGTAVEYNGSTNVDINTVYPKMLANLKTHFTHFYIGKGGFQGTFSGRAD